MHFWTNYSVFVKNARKNMLIEFAFISIYHNVHLECTLVIKYACQWTKRRRMCTGHHISADWINVVISQTDMAVHIKRYPKTRSARTFCQEKFACWGDNSVAKFECDSCGTVQCASCEEKLHMQAKFVFHDRKQIPNTPSEQLCSSQQCTDKNYAEITCTECLMNYCAPCFDKDHQSQRKRAHHKTKFRLDLHQRAAEINILHSPSHSTDDDKLKLSLTTTGVENCTMDKLPVARTASQDGSSSVDLFAEDPTLALDIVLSDSGGSSGREDSEPESIQQTSLDAHNDLLDTYKSFLLSDQNENLQVGNEEEFIQNLHCDRDDLVKVVSIFGNTGDGKSHTLNHTFFGGREVFLTSPSPMSCTTGVWAAFDAVHNAVVIDTEGLLGVSPNHNQRTRLLLKVLAVSDIVVYRTRAERLHNDLFQFLADASKAYSHHFSDELKAAAKRNDMSLPVSNMGPVVIIFHETQHTEIVGKSSQQSADELLRARFQDIGLDVGAYSSLHYVGTRTAPEARTDFRGLLLAVKSKLNDTSVRSPRKPSVVYSTLQVLNDKFSGEIDKSLPETFPDHYFTCRSQCLSCSAKCSERINHTQDDVIHSSSSRCRFRHEYENKVFLCKACYHRGYEVIVVPKTSASKESSWFGMARYAWSGFVLECPQCGVIYRSRQYWYGNEDPDKSVVQTEIRHVWPGANPVLQGTHNAARRVLDGFQYMSDTIVSIGAKPTKMVTNWVTDQIAPPYWTPNSEISHCRQCERPLDAVRDIHHCRACGQGFCDDCSGRQRRVPERGWGDMVVRVCEACYATGSPATNAMDASSDSTSDTNQLMPRKVGEVIGSTVGTVASLVNYPLDVLRDSARPQYWLPDAQITACCVCDAAFGPKLSIHHCRSCGLGVCATCSKTRRPVASRGWDYPVRVCDACHRRNATL